MKKNYELPESRSVSLKYTMMQDSQYSQRGTLEELGDEMILLYGSSSYTEKK